MTQIFSIGIPFVIGVVIAILLMKKFNAADKLRGKIVKIDNNNRNYDILIKEQEVCDTVSLEDLKPWFDSQKALQPDTADITFMLAKPANDISAMMGLDKPPANLDIEHNLLQAVILNKSEVAAIRLISYNSLPRDVKRKLDKGPVFVK